MNQIKINLHTPKLLAFNIVQSAWNECVKIRYVSQLWNVKFSRIRV